MPSRITESTRERRNEDAQGTEAGKQKKMNQITDSHTVFFIRFIGVFSWATFTFSHFPFLVPKTDAMFFSYAGQYGLRLQCLPLTGNRPAPVQ